MACGAVPGIWPIMCKSCKQAQAPEIASKKIGLYNFGAKQVSSVASQDQIKVLDYIHLRWFLMFILILLECHAILLLQEWL